MVPFLKASAEINAQKAKAMQEDLKRLQSVVSAANDDGSAKRTKSDKSKAANE